MTADLCINFLNTKVRIRTNSRLYAGFLEAYFGPLACECAASDAPLCFDVRWEKNGWKQASRFVFADDMTQIGGHTYMSSVKTAGLIKDGYKVLYSWDHANDPLTFRMIIRDVSPDSWRRRLRSRQQDQFFYETTLKGVYHPLFSYLRRHEEKLVLHASAVEYRGTTVVFSGLDGIGKSSLSLLLAQHPEATYISDNLIFADSRGIYPCYELIRLHSGAAGALDKSRWIRWNKSSCLKDFYQPSQIPASRMFKLGKFILLGFHPESRVARIGVKEAVSRCLSLNRLAGELSGYFASDSFYRLLKGPALFSDEAILESLLSSADCFSVQLDRSRGIEAGMTFLLREIGLS